jgi:hypothetical protein
MHWPLHVMQQKITGRDKALIKDPERFCHGLRNGTLGQKQSRVGDLRAAAKTGCCTLIICIGPYNGPMHFARHCIIWDLLDITSQLHYNVHYAGR